MATLRNSLITTVFHHRPLEAFWERDLQPSDCFRKVQAVDCTPSAVSRLVNVPAVELSRGGAVFWFTLI